MKEPELRQHATCTLCQRPIMHTGMPLFWRVKVERFGVIGPAVQRQTGLAAMLGSASLAAVMGADEDMATPMMEPITITVCEACAINRSEPVAMLAEASKWA